MNPRRHSRPLTELSTDQRICQGFDSEHALLLRSNLCLPITYLPCTEENLVALGLTEICALSGKGKVFWVPMPNNRQFRLGLAKGAAGEEEIRSVRRFHRLPRLLYVPLVWKDGEKDLWFSTAHVDRHELLNARNGALTGTDCVMPLDLVYEEAEAVSESRIPRLWRVITFSHPQVKIRLSGYNEEHMGSKASIMIIPQVYLGWCHDLQKNSTPLQKTSHSIEEWPGVWHVGDRATLSSYQIQTIDGIAQRLWTMYFANQPRSLVPLEDVVSATTSIPWRMPQGRQARIEV